MEKVPVLDEIINSEDKKIKIAFADIDGVLRGKYIHRDKFLNAAENGLGFCDVIFGWDSGDKCYENSKLTGWHTGYPDAKANIDLSTFRRIPWENNIPFFLGDFSKDPKYEAAVCSRSLLKRVAAQSEAMGFTPVFSQEFEWFNFSGTPTELHQSGFENLQPITPGMFGYSVLRSSMNHAYFHDLFDLLLQFNVPLEGMHTETGPGVLEATVIYDQVLAAADKAILFKTAVKEVAYRHGFMATFMAKWNPDLPGSGGHLHQSLWDSEMHRNLFYSKDDKHSMSDLMRNYMAGLMKCLPEILPMFAPNPNSYKRLIGGDWAPSTLTWGIDNRTTSLRVISGQPNSTRIELRIPGADTNAYLVMAASLAAGLYGIKNQLPLDTKPTVGNGYLDKKNGTLPTSLEEATRIMKESELAHELFGDAFVDHFTRTREWECQQVNPSDSKWELKRYFEII